ncbi:hypothetical protein [Agrobacterium radiobacter]
MPIRLCGRRKYEGQLHCVEKRGQVHHGFVIDFDIYDCGVDIN